MSAGAGALSNMILETSYDRRNQLLALPAVVVWAEAKRNQIVERCKPAYPWCEDYRLRSNLASASPDALRL